MTQGWLEEYEEEDIYEGNEFYNRDGSISKVTMLWSEENTYLENDYFTGFQRPYKNGYAFVGLLPKKMKSKSYIKRAIENTDFASFINSGIRKKVWVNMPEFTAQTDIDLTDFCKSKGMKKIFEPGADFSNITSADVMVSGIKHKAKIEVERHGTKAAAATMEMFVAGCAPMFEERAEVTLDHPFLYFIVNDETKLPIFSGMVNHIDS